MDHILFFRWPATDESQCYGDEFLARYPDADMNADTEIAQELCQDVSHYNI